MITKRSAGIGNVMAARSRAKTPPSTKTPKPNIVKPKRIVVGATKSGKPVTAATVARPSRAERIARIHRDAQSSLIEIQRNINKRKR